MIACSVELTDFLSHRCPDGQPVVFDFVGARLWSVAGDNGAGKSAIFDAITWTLYGRHRAGTQDAKRLISHGADRCQAAFVFELGGTRYRVERTLPRRGNARRAARRWDPDTGWMAITDTETEDGFGRWRDGVLSLSYEAFTQSVLLVQGGSDQLIASGAKQRFDILAQLIDLAFYRRLEERAARRVSSARSRRQELGAELEREPVVTAEERTAAEEELERLEAARETDQQAWKEQVAVVEGARTQVRLVARSVELDKEIDDAEGLLRAGVQIREAATERDALNAALPHLRAALKALRLAATARDAAVTARAERDAIDVAALQGAAESAAEQAREARATAQAAATHGRALQDVQPRLETAIQRRLDRLRAASTAATAGAPQAARAALNEARKACGELEGAAKTAREQERVSERAVAVAKAAAAGAEAALERAQAGVEEATCTRCGQPVPPQHRAAHLLHLQQDVDDKRAALDMVEAQVEPLRFAREASEAAVDDARGQVTTAEAALARAEAGANALSAAQEAEATARDAVGGWDDERAPLLDCGDAVALEALRNTLRAEARDAGSAEGAAAQALTDADDAAREASDAAGSAERRRGRHELALQRQTETARTEERLAELELAQIPDAWVVRVRLGEDDLPDTMEARRRELEPLARELPALERADAVASAAKAARAEISTQIEALPASHRVPLDGAEDELQRRASAAHATTVLVEQAEAQLRELDERERRRAETKAALDDAVRAERLAARLAALLGRGGIQGQLIVRAARGLEVLANETLRAISGGTLELEIRADERRGRDEVVITARDFTAGGERTDASFLSGSEKFRVCVAMAAAIGAYASGRAMLESLIIDEGFGSLDATARDEMIDELQRLSQLRARVIVVSHQAEFHDRTRFPHGYRLRRAGDVTEVERFV